MKHLVVNTELYAAYREPGGVRTYRVHAFEIEIIGDRNPTYHPMILMDRQLHVERGFTENYLGLTETHTAYDLEAIFADS